MYALLLASLLNVQDGPVVDWLHERALTLEAEDPETEADDLDFLDAVLGDARVVLLGEEVHGVREFSLLKHRMIRVLVERHGFDTIAFEQDTLRCQEIDHYVKTGEGAPERSLASCYWCWNNEEVLGLIRWMRAHAARTGEPVSFVGVDNQGAGSAARMIRELVEASDLEPVFDLEPALGPFELGRSAYQEKGTTFGVEHGAALEELERYLVHDHEGAGLDAAAILAEVHALWTAPNTRARMNTRDRQMAERTRALVERGSKVIVWAHNAHVSRAVFYGGVHPLGEHVSKDLPTLVVGFYFGAGEYLLDPRSREDGETRIVEVPAEGSLAATLALVREGIWVADLRGAMPLGVGEWFSAPPSGHFDNYGPAPSLRGAIDLLVYVPLVSPSASR